MSELVRDFVGYGRNRPQFEWPGGKRVALSIVVNYEEGGENCVLDGDAYSETLNSDVIGAQPRLGRRNLNIESHYEYGSRVGHWRILDLLHECQIPATYFAVSSALEKHPEAARSIIEAGHEIVSHGARWIDYEQIDYETENSHMKESLNVIERLSGVRPVGWYTGRISINTRSLAQKHGLLYDSDAYNDDLPYWTRTNNHPHLVLPYNFDCNDMRFSTAPGFNTPDDFLVQLQRTLECLRREGTKHPQMMSVGLHLRLAGRPARTEAIREFLLRTKEYDDVWFCRREDIAMFWHKQFPSSEFLL
jgi:allantoinase